MILSANQPYFLPYFPYWQLIDCADMYLIADYYSYIKKHWITRNYILVKDKPIRLGLTVRNASFHRTIKDTFLLPPFRENLAKTVRMAYHSAPFFEDGYKLFEKITSYENDNLCDFLSFSIKEVCSYLGITTKIGYTSDFEGNNLLKKEQRIYDFCKRAGADTYVNAIGGQDIYSFEDFAKHGIRLRFLRSTVEPYKQFWNPFVSNLSVIDAIMFCSKEQLSKMLSQRTFIDE
ncbi:MAG: WbqC family protein [Bacteroidales bacterium]|nr:WbqC family protein [Bacteroidales bacterium]